MTWDNATRAEAGATMLKATAGTQVMQSSRHSARATTFFAVNVLDKRAHFPRAGDKAQVASEEAAGSMR